MIVYRPHTIPLPFLYYSHAKYKLYNMHSTLPILPIPVPFLYHSCTIPMQNVGCTVYTSSTLPILNTSCMVPFLYHPCTISESCTVCTVPFPYLPFLYHSYTITVPFLNQSYARYKFKMITYLPHLCWQLNNILLSLIHSLCMY